MSNHREPRAGSWRALVEQEAQQARARDAMRGTTQAPPGSAVEAPAEPVLGPWPFGGIEATLGPWVATDIAAGADETTRRRGVPA